MKRSYLIITIVALVLVGSLVGFIIVSVSTFANVTRTYNFAYNPGSPAPIEGLDLYTDIGYVDIKYNTSAMSEYITVDVTVSMSGGFMAGKEPEDFFNSPTDWWDTSSSPAVFNMYLNPIAWWDPVNWFKSILVAINVTLRTDVVYDLKAMTATGSMDALFPDNVVINDTILTTTTGRMGVKTEANSVVNGRFHLSATTGNINLDADDAEFGLGIRTISSTGGLVLNFTDCTMGSEVTAQVTTGNIDFSSRDMIYSGTAIWDFDSTTGAIFVYLYQSFDMTHDVTGSLQATTGGIDFMYIDSTLDVGASFFGTVTTGTFFRINNGGFGSESSNPFLSNDYGTAVNTYTLTLTTSTGGIRVNGTSTP